MEYREFGRTGWKVSAISLGMWAMGSSWGEVKSDESYAALNRALDLGVNFFDTADVYGSEPLLGKLRKSRKELFYIASKLGRSSYPFPGGLNRKNMTAFIDNSLRRLQVETIDLIQLHCLPIETSNAETFGMLDDLAKQGKIRHYGVSVQTIEEALKAMEFPGVQSIQIIFNIFRQRPITDFFPQARQTKTAVIARVPLASGLLTGKMTPTSTFASNDHRTYNRSGEAFDKGETFSGVDFATGLQAVEELRPLVPAGATMAQLALRWILMFPEVTCAIPGAKRPAQAEDNINAASLPPLSEATMYKLGEVYDRFLRPEVHNQW
jgi:aryl-alcohol dehydrogenase-like predicted oxidoreductase